MEANAMNPGAECHKKLFLCVRWGHAESPEGADGEDTHFVVRADSHEEAAELADAILGSMPTHVDGNPRVVESHCHHVLEIGTDHTGHKTSAVLLGPAIGYALRTEQQAYPSWYRGEIPGEFVWRTHGEVFAR